MKRDECSICGGRNGNHSPWCGNGQVMARCNHVPCERCGLCVLCRPHGHGKGK